MKIIFGILVVTLSLSFSAEARKNKWNTKSRKNVKASKTVNHCANTLKNIPELNHYGEALERNDGSIDRFSNMSFNVAGRQVQTTAKSNRRGRKDWIESVSYRSGDSTLDIRFAHDNKGKCYPQEIKRNGQSIFNARTCRDANRWVRDYGKKLADCKRMGVGRKLKNYFSSLRGKDKAFANVKSTSENLEGELMKLHSKCKWPSVQKIQASLLFLKIKTFSRPVLMSTILRKLRR